MIRLLLSLLLLSSSTLFTLKAQQTGAEKLKVVSAISDYRATIKASPEKELLDIKKEIPDITLDIRYATENNFMKRVMYPEASAFARKPVVQQLKNIQKELRKQGLGLKIYDAYRPYAITVAFYQQAKDKNFVASPAKGSKHNRGCAVDLTLIDYKTKKELEMPTAYDSFEAAAAATYQNISAPARKNRDLLIKTMHKHGFRVLHNEWWHFDFIGWQKFELLDIPFKNL
jgi:D-alanyl-D-alanine dipeptidase